MDKTDSNNEDLNSRQDSEQQESFIKERVLDRDADRKKTKMKIRFSIGLVISAILFGAVASLVFAFLVPMLQNGKETGPKETAVVIPTDEETQAPETSAPEQTQESSEDIEKIVDDAVSRITWKYTDYAELVATVSAQATQANKGIVTVLVNNPDTDLFENAINKIGQSCGVIWNISSSEVLILTTANEMKEDTTIEVAFVDGKTCPATLRGTDDTTGISIISVAKSEMDEMTLASIDVLQLGSSLMTAVGTPVLFVGSPTGYVGSVDFGIISYIRSNVMGEDTESRIFDLNMSTTDQSAGFILDMEQRIIGMVLPGMTGRITSAIGISDLKSVMELIANGKTAAYLGVVGQDVTEAISQKNNIPVGVYLSDVKMGGPAFEAGLQNGDVITKIGSVSITSVKVLETTMLAHSPEETVVVEVARPDRDSYTEIPFAVKLGKR